MSITPAIRQTGWPTVPLGQLCEVNIGRTPARDRQDYWGPGLPWLSIADMNQGRDIAVTKETITELAVRECNCRIAKAGTVLLSFKLSIGKVGIAQIPLFTNEAIAALPIIDSTRLSAEYLYWALRSTDLTLGLDRAAKGLTLNKAKLLDIPIPLPPLAKQRRIVAILDSTDALRAKRRAALAQLDTLTQAIFLDMFGDPETNPKGWPKTELGAVVKVQGGYSFKSEDFAAEGKAVIRISNLVGEKIRLQDVARIPQEKLGKGAALRIEPGSILIAMSGATTGKLGVVPEHMDEDLYQNQRVGKYRIQDASKIDRKFLLALLRSTFYQRFLWQLAWGAAQPNVSSGQLESALVPLPPLTQQQDFACRAAAVEKIANTQRTALGELDALFAALQHQAFRGEL